MAPKNKKEQANPLDALKKSKLASVRTAIKQLEKSTKKEGLVHIMGERPMPDIQWIKTGSLMFDLAINNGIPKGRIVEFFGRESSGKTLCATRAAVECQRDGGLVAFIDMEHAFDPAFAATFGLNIDELIFSQPSHMQEAFTIIDALVDAGVDLIILDSIASLVPKEELEGEVGKQTIGLVARYMSQFLRRITGKLSANNSTLICINQVRDAIGVMYGDPTTTPGGKSLKFYASLRVQVSRVSGSEVKVKSGGEENLVGYSIKATIKKNKVGIPFKKAEFPVFLDGRENDQASELAAVALLKGLIPKYDAQGNLSATGRTYKWPTEPLFLAKKKDDVEDELRKFPKIQEEIIEMLKNGIEPDQVHDSEDFESEMSEDEFEEMIRREAEDLKNGKNMEAEETSSGESNWDSI